MSAHAQSGCCELPNIDWQSSNNDIEQNKNTINLIEDKRDEAGCYGYQYGYGYDRIRGGGHDVDDGYWRLGRLL